MDNQVYDVIIVGAGPAGCFCASHLAAAGKNVLVLEKNDKAHSKACGDGISVGCVQLLRDIGFPIEKFEQSGAAKINKIIHTKLDGMVIRSIDTSAEPRYGLSRHKTDMLFRSFAEEKGAHILYKTNVDKIYNEDGLFRLGEYKAKDIVIACGAFASLNVCGRSVKSDVDTMAAGISATIGCANGTDSGFTFVYDPKLEGTYAWVFKTDGDNYNVGLWLKKDKSRLKKLFREFLNSYVPQALQAQFTVVTPPRGAIMPVKNISEQFNRNSEDGVFFAGDVCGTADPLSGEGISQAILSGLSAAKKILERNSSE